MKILVPSPVTPNRKNLRTFYISEITKYFQKITNLDLFWFVYQPDKINMDKISGSNLLNIHDFDNAIDCLNKIKPDCVMVGSRYEPIQYAFSLACKKLKIPLISFYYTGYDDEKSQSISHYNKILYNSRNIISNQIPTDSINRKSFLRRLRFILFKINFLKNTKKLIQDKSNYLEEFFSYFKIVFIKKEFPINILPDLYLLPDTSWIEPLQKIGVQKNKLAITGSPFWDRLYRNSKKYNPKKTNENNISILIVTDAMVEHGMWTRSKFTLLITNLLEELSKNSKFVYSFKIHPASEDKQIYQNLFQNLNINSKIYQNEDIWDILDKFDLVLTFGASTIHSELSLIGVKTIILDFNFDFPLMTYVKEGIEFGNIKICDDIHYLNNLIIDFAKNKDVPSQSFISTRDQLIYKFDGKSSQRCCEAILEFLKNF